MPAAYAAALAALGTTGLLLIAAGVHGGPPRPGTAAAAGRLRRWWRAGSTAGRLRAGRLRVGVAVGEAVVALVATGVPVAAVLAGAAVPVLPWVWNAGRRERRAIDRAEALGDWTRRLQDQIATGTGLVAAIAGSAGTAPEPIRERVRSLASRVGAGMPPVRALHLFADEVDDSVADQVVAALLLHLRDRGEHLAEVLTAISTDAARQVSTRREADARRAQSRLTVRFMLVFAGLVTAVLAYAGLLAAYRDPAGQGVLLVLAAGFVAVLVAVNRMSAPPPSQRFLPPAEVR
jgi:Flp pilus assembly protein TadB